MTMRLLAIQGIHIMFSRVGDVGAEIGVNSNTINYLHTCPTRLKMQDMAESCMSIIIYNVCYRIQLKLRVKLDPADNWK